MAVDPTAGETVLLRRKRLRYRAWHRGTKEMDMLLGRFADANLDRFDEAMLDRFEALIGEADTDLSQWLLGQMPVPANIDGELLAEIVADHHRRLNA